jgi:hypothetical protein
MLVLRTRHLVATVLLVLAVFALVGSGAGPALASMGNRGVPVRCFAPGSGITAGNAAFMTCYAADGTSFAGNQRVPSGYYLLLTDVLVSPRAGSSTTGVTEISVYDAYGTSGRQSQILLRSTRTDTYGYTFASPYLVLSADHRLEIVSAGVSAFPVDVRASGLLVNSAVAVPLVMTD